MAKFVKTEFSDRFEYVLHDDSLPEGCTHSGVTRNIIWKPADETDLTIRVEQRMCEHTRNDNTFQGCIDAVESGSEIVGS